MNTDKRIEELEAMDTAINENRNWNSEIMDRHEIIKAELLTLKNKKLRQIKAESHTLKN